MKLKDFINKALFYISVPKCVACGKKLDIESKALCTECLIEYMTNKELNCSICAKSYDECTCSNTYLAAHSIKNLFKVFRYHPDERRAENYIIYALKEDNRSDVFDFLASELSASIKDTDFKIFNPIITNIPRRKSAINKFGYDHAEILARKIGKILNIEYKRILTSKSEKSQKETSGTERRTNPNFSIIDDNLSLKGRDVIIVDDIVTTGSSLSSAGMLIRSLGARRIFGATLAIAYKDERIIFDTSDRFIPTK